MTENEKFLNETHVFFIVLGVLFKNPWSKLSLVD